MKIYRVIHDAELVLVTADELKALRLFRKNMEKRNEVMNWGWIEEETV